MRQHRDVSGVGERLHDTDVMVGVRVLLDLLDVTDGETIEKIHDDNHHEEQEDDKDESAKPMFHGNVWIVKLSSQHNSCPDQRW